MFYYYNVIDSIGYIIATLEIPYPLISDCIKLKYHTIRAAQDKMLVKKMTIHEMPLAAAKQLYELRKPEV